MIILIILIIVLLLSFFFINKTLKKKDNILEDVKLQENTIRNNGFALMLQKEDGTYQESTSSSNFPTNMKFNTELSGCIDINGNKIDGALSYNNDSKLVTLQANKTSYCYAYFDKYSLNEYLINNVSSEELWNSTLEEDGYRYVGIDPNNYICFGTADKDTCINDTDKYMYRIIGIFEDEAGNKHTKLIKKEALNTTYAWHSDDQTDVDWDESDLYKGINGSYFLTNILYPYMQDSTWTNKIAIWNYTMTNKKSDENNSLSYSNEIVQSVYLHELNRSGKTSNVGEWKTLNTKISLMYVSDYALSLGSDALTYTTNSNFLTMKTGWMHISNNDTDTQDHEWTMSRSGWGGSFFFTSFVHFLGFVNSYSVSNNCIVRPVFYLESDVELADNSGDGSINNLYILGL